MSHKPRFATLRNSLAVLVAALFVVACNQDSPTDPGDEATGPSFSGGTLTGEHVTVCTDASSPAGTYTFTTSADTDDGTFAVSSPFDLGEATCVDVWQDDGAAGESDPVTTITVTETGLPSGVQLDNIVVDNPLGSSTSGSTATAEANGFHGATITFFHSLIPVGGEGCTPGYWRQPHHFDSWTGHDPEDLFGDTFDLPAELEIPEQATDPASLTLLDGLELNGGGVNALIRHAVAGLLNAASPDVDYDLSESDVISAFNDAIAEGGDIEGTKDALEGFNEQGCPLD